MAKVVLPKDVAIVAESINHLGDDKFDLKTVLRYLGVVKRDTLQDFLNDPNIEGYRLWFTALVNGYEVEKTPKEKAIQHLKYKNDCWAKYSEHDAITEIMNILGVKDDANSNLT